MTDPLLTSPLVQSIGWALIHFVWQGTVIGIATALTIRALAGARPALRYAVACFSMALMLLVPAVTVLSDRAPDSLALGLAAAASVNVVSPVPLDRLLPAAVIVWLAGVLLLSGRIVVACAVVERLKRATKSVDATVVARVQSLAHRLGVHRRVRVRESTLVRVPTVVGHLRPVILLPASVITGLAPEYLDAVLAHELAHVRRHDYLVNVLQSLVETLLFYHPAVWWCSRQIRIEREHCCDDVVVETGGNRLAYATALTQLEELRGLEPMLPLNASGGRLADRIRRLLGESPMNERRTTAWTIAAALAVVAALVVTPARSVADASELVVSPPSGERHVNPAQVPESTSVARDAERSQDADWADHVRVTRAALETLARETQGVAIVPEPPASQRQAQPAPQPLAQKAPQPPQPPAPLMPGTAAVPPIPPPPRRPNQQPAQPAQAAYPTEAPAAPAPPAPPAPPPDPPRLPDAPLVPDVSEIAAELHRAAAELMKGLDEMRRATQEIAMQQAQLEQTRAALEQMKKDVMARNTDIDAIRRTMAELSASRAAATQSDMTEMRKRIDAMSQELQKLRAREF